MAARKYYFSCPYCGKRYEREDLVAHVDKYHGDEIPEGFTPMRVVYHVANNRAYDDPRKCRICGKPTPWDENKGRYDQLCGSPECKKKQAEKMSKGMGNKLRSNSPTKTPEGLEKMLAGRRISHKYTWSDGTVFTYTGTYEGKFLQWMDKIMHIKSEDLMIPGPVIYYEFNEEERIYIPDCYYIPYNAIIEIKDGGEHKNNDKAREETRMKVLAKEKHIIEKTNYHYIRLTDNDFSQLLAFFSDLKMNFIDNTGERVIHVNEHMAWNMHRMMTPQHVINKGVVVVNYMQNMAFLGKSGIAVSNSKDLDPLYKVDKMGRLKKYSAQVLGDCSYNVYEVADCEDRVRRFIETHIGEETTDNEIYEAVFGHERLSEDQILFEEKAVAYDDYYKKLYKEYRKQRKENKDA